MTSVGMSTETISRVRRRISTVLSRPVVTDSDKKKFLRLKDQVLSDSRSKTIYQAKTLILEKAKRRVPHSSLESSVPRQAFSVYNAPGRFFVEVTTRGFSELQVQFGFATSALRSWLKKPVTVGTLLTVLAIWTLALTFQRFAFPWSEIGYTSGYGAIVMTALVTARLTVNSQRLWVDHPRHREAAREMNRWLIETALARKSLVLHEIEEFLSSSMYAQARETNLKANAFVMRKRDWQALQDALYDTFLKGAPPLLFELGHLLGSSVGRDLTTFHEKPSAMLAQLEDVSRTLGWGIVTVDGDLLRGSKMKFKVRESPFCVAQTQLEKNKQSCHMLCGMMSGIAEEVYGWPCTAYEQECVRDGRDSCTIVVTQATNPHVGKDRWKLSVLFPVVFPWSR